MKKNEELELKQVINVKFPRDTEINKTVGHLPGHGFLLSTPRLKDDGHTISIFLTEVR